MPNKRLQYNREWRQNNPEQYAVHRKAEAARLKANRDADPEYRARMNEQTKQHYHKIKNEQPERFLLQAARKRAKAKGIDCTITVDDIVIPLECPVFGFALTKSDGRFSPTSPSLDRIDVSKGYVPGNVQVISMKANTMKNNATPEELRRFATWVLK